MSINVMLPVPVAANFVGCCYQVDCQSPVLFPVKYTLLEITSIRNTVNQEIFVY